MKLETLENVADEQESSGIKCRKDLNQKSRLSSRNDEQGSSEKIFEQEQFQLLDSKSEAGPLEETDAMEASENLHGYFWVRKNTKTIK